jgi:tetratricopeptide (TPR) repeat protein/tRNA A-37 threonylcarbamoyl transferase component Bud32
MTQERAQWQQVEQLFYEALDLPTEERSAFLDRACGAEESLRQEVESLLAASEKTAGFLRKPAEEVARQFAREAQFDRIGPYRILNLIGQGGMGKVYLAERADQSYRQLVAIKLMQASGLSKPEMVARFRTERQILANLDHPNIARLLDGGMTPEGHPYLVMEFIDGRPVNEYSPGRKLSIEERLKLFRAICAAVEYAHGRLVVHRDIKPGNILVTPDGTPKLLDFGIAKFLDPEITDSRQAQTVERLMTFEYASPEQVRGDAATTLTDVYALGVLLYQLLTGVLPFRFETSSPLEAAKVICENDPLPPSVTASHSGASPKEIHALRGDLDSIALKAMRKEPEYRYQSAVQLSADIDAYLQGYPVQARTGSWSYGTGKFVRRHRTAVAASALLALALVVFGAAMGFLAQRATREQMIAARESQFLASVLEASAPGHTPGQAVTALELLDRGARRIHHEFSEAPDAHASLISTMARAYTNLGRTDRATDLAEECYRICVKTYGENSPLVLPAIHLRATLLRNDGKYADAEPLFRREVALAVRIYGKDDLAVASALTGLGECLYQEGKYVEAEMTLREALALHRQHTPDSGSDARNDLALVMERKGARSEASDLFREAMEIDARSTANNQPSLK